MKKLAVIVGAGRGMGNNIAERFAKENFKIVLVARNKKNLDAYVEEFSKKHYEVFGKSADVSNFEEMTKIFAEIQQEFGAVDVLIYNAAFMQGVKLTEIDANEVLEHFKIDVAGAVNCVKHILPKQIEQKSGAIIFTGGLFGVYPNHNKDFACMSIDKSALRAVAKMLNEELAEKNIFVGIVEIMGGVGMNEHFSAKNIAEAYWKLYSEKNNFEFIYD